MYYSPPIITAARQPIASSSVSLASARRRSHGGRKFRCLPFAAKAEDDAESPQPTSVSHGRSKETASPGARYRQTSWFNQTRGRERCSRRRSCPPRRTVFAVHVNKIIQFPTPCWRRHARVVRGAAKVTAGLYACNDARMLVWSRTAAIPSPAHSDVYGNWRSSKLSSFWRICIFFAPLLLRARAPQIV